MDPNYHIFQMQHAHSNICPAESKAKQKRKKKKRTQSGTAHTREKKIKNKIHTVNIY